MGAAKIAVFAYHRETRQPVWQSGIARASSSAKDTWLLGAGPFQSGTIHKQPKFAGERLDIPLLQTAGDVSGPDPLTMYNREVHFVQPPRDKPKRLPAEGQQANFEDPADPPDPPDPMVRLVAMSLANINTRAAPIRSSFARALSMIS